MQRRASMRCGPTIAPVGQASIQRVQLPQWSLACSSGARNSQLPWSRLGKLVCLPCHPMPAAADSGFSITGAVSTNTFSWQPASSASQRPIAFSARLTVL